MPTVVIADDSPTLRRIVSTVLEREGFTVVQAEDGVDAVQAVFRTMPDAVVLDGEPGLRLFNPERPREVRRIEAQSVLAAAGDDVGLVPVRPEIPPFRHPASNSPTCVVSSVSRQSIPASSSACWICGAVK